MVIYEFLSTRIERLFRDISVTFRRATLFAFIQFTDLHIPYPMEIAYITRRDIDI